MDTLMKDYPLLPGIPTLLDSNALPLSAMLQGIEHCLPLNQPLLMFISRLSSRNTSHATIKVYLAAIHYCWYAQALRGATHSQMAVGP